MDRSILTSEIVEKLYPYRFFLARMTEMPLIGKIVDAIFFSDKDDLIYLPRKKVVQVNESIGTQENMALPSQIVEHFINEASYIWKMNFCICRKSNRCENYPIELGCLFLGEAARNIHPQFGEEITEKEALEHVKKCREEGLFHMIGRTKFDTVWLNVNPGEKLLVVCNCCPCCCLTSTLSHLDPGVKMKSVVHKMPGVEVQITDDCTGCGKCTEGVCLIDGIEMKDNKAVIGDDCWGCGHCVDSCPQGAIELILEKTDFLEKSVDRIEEVIDL